MRRLRPLMVARAALSTTVACAAMTRTSTATPLVPTRKSEAAQFRVAPFPRLPPFFPIVAAKDGDRVPGHLALLLESILVREHQESRTVHLTALVIHWSHGTAMPARRRRERDVTVLADFYAPGTRVYSRYEIRRDDFVERQERLPASWPAPRGLQPGTVRKLADSYGLPWNVDALRRNGLKGPLETATLTMHKMEGVAKRTGGAGLLPTMMPSAQMLAWKVKSAQGRTLYVATSLGGYIRYGVQ